MTDVRADRDTTRSRELMARARELFPGGVSSPVRAFGGVGGEPFVVERGAGARIWDVDGNEYLDYVLSWGPLVLGHAAPVVLDALRATMARGTSFGIPTGLEVELAELVRARMPHVEMLRFVSSGTEATMSALRVARAATGRDLLLKFDGCYHGHGDSFLVRAGSGVATLGLPNSPGVPDALAALTLVAPYNDVAAVEELLRRHAGRVAAIIVEPVIGNAGFIPPDPAFLPALRRLADAHGALLIFDEVMTGFRVAWGGAQLRYGIVPDLTCLGKVIGGGMPVAAYGGRRAIMEIVAPFGPV
jgi:glutamate-1-semialdehyde 2,1-aminomutase